MKIEKENLRLFINVFKFYRNFCENLWKNLDNFGNMDLQRASENIKKIVEKSMETRKILKIFMNF